MWTDLTELTEPEGIQSRGADSNTARVPGIVPLAELVRSVHEGCRH